MFIQRYKLRKEPAAFTLIELLVVISIIAILMAIMMPALRKAREQAKNTICGSNVHQIAIGLHTYAADYDSKLPLIRYWSQGTQDLKPANKNQLNIQMTALYTLGYLPEKKLFYSPSDTARKLETVGEFQLSDGGTNKVDNIKGWELIEAGEVASENLTLTFSYQQVLHIARTGADMVAERYLRIDRYKTLVADRFCNDNMWSFHGGDEKMSYSMNSSPIESNGKGWHIGMADGAVIWGDNDERVFEYMREKRAELSQGRDFWLGGDWFKYWGSY